jgi:hypothetical protein
MRIAGSSASSNPVWSVSLTVKAGGTYTVVPLRTSSEQGSLKVIDNNLTTPNGKSLVRVIQADINLKTMTFHCSCAPGTPGNITTDAAAGHCWSWPEAGGCAETRCVRSPRAEDAYPQAGRHHLGGRLGSALENPRPPSASGPTVELRG